MMKPRLESHGTAGGGGAGRAPPRRGVVEILATGGCHADVSTLHGRCRINQAVDRMHAGASVRTVVTFG